MYYFDEVNTFQLFCLIHYVIRQIYYYVTSLHELHLLTKTSLFVNKQYTYVVDINKQVSVAILSFYGT